MNTPSNYKTLAGLLRATERVLQLRKKGITRFSGQSDGMWLHNARHVAEQAFQAGNAIVELIQKYSVSRPQDLQSLCGDGHAVFGAPLPRRDYIVGDTVPGFGHVDDATETQLFISGTWYHRSVFESSQPAAIG
ncbi:hypothetical protein SAMN05216178_6886 [Pseudomonas saponiphila]|jgi:hypothetical protein|uniref:Uncharacterized protein n=1 Tax=Pseudomonas saponiphila TaxID=556534 RepID=A0A1H4ZXB9_9PSED|nr:hypothetical protein [Pseudomonas saponiphila]SED34866.1 hypothetical protein SAMN05216178_6886 [Pseudomonas saponiphila]